MALKSGDVAGALAMVAELDRQATDEAQRAAVQSLLARCIAELHEPVDVTATVTPYVDLLLDFEAALATKSDGAIPMRSVTV